MTTAAVSAVLYRGRRDVIENGIKTTPPLLLLLLLLLLQMKRLK